MDPPHFHTHRTPAMSMKKKAARTRPKHAWTAKQLALIGKVSDGELARQIGATTSVVFLKRNSMGIAASRPWSSLKWGPKELALLGKHTDTEVARRLNTTRKSVIHKRLSLGITCYATASKLWHTWTKEEIALLGKRTDPDVAQKVGISAMCVTTKRRQLNIPSFRIRKSTNRPRRSVEDWTKREIALLGTLPDSKLAELLDLGSNTVRLKRICMGIPPCRTSDRGPGIWTPEVLARLGKEPARKIADDIGVSRQRVQQKCKELGIVSTSSKKRSVAK